MPHVYQSRAKLGQPEKYFPILGQIWPNTGMPQWRAIEYPVPVQYWTACWDGCESWTITNAMKKRLEAAEMWMYRRMLRISWKDFKTNDEVLKICKSERELLTSIKARQMSFLGHIMRHSDTEKLILTGTIKGSRAKGRPRTSYMDNFGECGATVNEILNLTLDRSRWKKRKNEIVKQRVKKPKLHK